MKMRMLTFAPVIAATALHAEERMPFTNLPVSGLYDTTALIVRSGEKQLQFYPRPCLPPGKMCAAETLRGCLQARDFRFCTEEEYRQDVRARLGDPGRH